MNSVKAIIDTITHAFQDVRLEDGVSLHEAEVIDAYGTDSERRAARKLDVITEWSQVSTADIERHDSILNFLDPKGFRYYVPAYMIWSLRNYRRSNSATIDSTIYAFNLSKNDVSHKWQIERFSILSNDQARAVCAFLKHMAYDAEDHVDSGIARDALRDFWKRFE